MNQSMNQLINQSISTNQCTQTAGRTESVLGRGGQDRKGRGAAQIHGGLRRHRERVASQGWWGHGRGHSASGEVRHKDSGGAGFIPKKKSKNKNKWEKRDSFLIHFLFFTTLGHFCDLRQYDWNCKCCRCRSYFGEFATTHTHTHTHTKFQHTMQCVCWIFLFTKNTFPLPLLQSNLILDVSFAKKYEPNAAHDKEWFSFIVHDRFGKWKMKIKTAKARSKKIGFNLSFSCRRLDKMEASAVEIYPIPEDKPSIRRAIDAVRLMEGRKEGRKKKKGIKTNSD